MGQRINNENVVSRSFKGDDGQDNTVYISVVKGSTVKMLRELTLEEMKDELKKGSNKITEEDIRITEKTFQEEEQYLDLTT